MQCMLLAGCLPRVLWPFAGVSCPALKFFQEIIHVLPNIFSMAESDLILVLLSLVDMTLVGGFAGDGDVFRLREFRLTTRYL